MLNYSIYTDGGARGNPGRAAVGVYIIDENGKEIFKKGKVIGEATNNTAEYTAIITALQWVSDNLKEDEFRLSFFLDSLLVVNQINGIYKIKEKRLRELIVEVRILEQTIGKPIFYSYIPREKNIIADKLVNTSLDPKK